LLPIRYLYVLTAQGRCHFGQPSLPIAVTNHIDGFGGSLNDGITWLRGESGIRFGSQLIVRIFWKSFVQSERTFHSVWRMFQ